MFATASIARRIEQAEAGLIAEGARAAARRLPAEQVAVRFEVSTLADSGLVRALTTRGYAGGFRECVGAGVFTLAPSS
jgi:hypothetical protein